VAERDEQATRLEFVTVTSGGMVSELFDPHFALLDEWVPKESFPGRENRELVRLMQKR